MDMNYDIEIDRKRKEEKKRRKLRSFKLIFVFICLMIIITCFGIYKNYNLSTNILGNELVHKYSNDNIKYKIENEKTNEYILIKRKGNNVIYEDYRKVSRKDYTLKKYYFDLRENKVWKILDDEKIIITDEYSEYVPEVLNNSMINLGQTYAENYAVTFALSKTKSDKILAFNSAKDVKLDNKLVFEINIKTTEGNEKTYFDKETFLPIKSIVDREKNEDIIRNIIVTFGEVTDEDFNMINEYKKMTDIDYKEYKRVMEL